MTAPKPSASCPHIVSSDDGTSYCALATFDNWAEIDALRAENERLRRLCGDADDRRRMRASLNVVTAERGLLADRLAVLTEAAEKVAEAWALFLDYHPTFQRHRLRVIADLRAALNQEDTDASE